MLWVVGDMNCGADQARALTAVLVDVLVERQARIHLSRPGSSEGESAILASVMKTIHQAASTSDRNLDATSLVQAGAMLGTLLGQTQNPLLTSVARAVHMKHVSLSGRLSSSSSVSTHAPHWSYSYSLLSANLLDGFVRTIAEASAEVQAGKESGIVDLVDPGLWKEVALSLGYSGDHAAQEATSWFVETTLKLRDDEHGPPPVLALSEETSANVEDVLDSLKDSLYGAQPFANREPAARLSDFWPHLASAPADRARRADSQARRLFGRVIEKGFRLPAL